MEYRKQEKLCCRPSLLGMGCMRLPQTPEGAIDRKKAREMVAKAFKSGINYFDTAYRYHGGESEDFVGEALAEYPRDSFYLATKMPVWMAQSLEQVEEIFADQLKKCRVGYFDFYLCHALDKERFDKMEKMGIYDFLAKKKEEGIIRRLGFSFHDTPEVLREICEAHPWDFAQIQLNYLDWTLQRAKEQYEILEEFGLPCVVMEPVRGGALAKLCPEAEALLKEAAPSRSIASWAIRYAASKPNVMVVLSGMSNEEQMADNLSTFDPFVPLSETEQKVLAQALEIDTKAQRIPCTGCSYCMPCPFGVDIPGVFKVYNDCAVKRSTGSFAKTLSDLPEAAWPEQCRACGKCMKVCPQHIQIPDKMKELDALNQEQRKKA